MKKMKYIIGLGLSLFLASCTDALDLQPKSDLTQTNFLSSTYKCNFLGADNKQ